MKAFSPVRSVRKNSLSDHSLGISRSKTPVDDPMSLLYNMNDCYSKLKELVPSIPQNKKVSKMEILQHVIDYILDLQIALDSHPTIVSLHHQRPGQSQASRTPLTTLNTDISILSLQVRPAPGAPLAAAQPGDAWAATGRPIVETVGRSR
uniref:DNA-binding protein inhibitor ID-2 n=1 Tax=Sus scrofa TaxID=9823 RepID=A0A8D0XCN4_PIG